jgi:hypothetical protein
MGRFQAPCKYWLLRPNLPQGGCSRGSGGIGAEKPPWRGLRTPRNRCHQGRCKCPILSMRAFGRASAGGAFHGCWGGGDGDRSTLVRRQDRRSLLGGAANGGLLGRPADGGLCRGTLLEGGSGQGKKRDHGQCSVFHRLFLSWAAASKLTSTIQRSKERAETICRARLLASMPAGRRGKDKGPDGSSRSQQKAPDDAGALSLPEREISTSRRPGRYPSGTCS